MHPIEFQRIFDETVAAVAGLASVKSGEYASNADLDRLGNFKDAGKRQKLIPEKVLMVYLDKHFAAISNFVEDLTVKRARERSEPIDGRVNDLVLYAILLKCLIAEREELQGAMNAEEEDEVRHMVSPVSIVEPKSTLVWDEEDDNAQL
jgi:hypothetical protein